jgi:hypothetical protein
MQTSLEKPTGSDPMSKVFLDACDDFRFRSRLQSNAAAAVANHNLSPDQVQALGSRKYRDVRLAMVAPEERPTIYVAVNVVVVVTAAEVPTGTIQ